MGPPIVPVAGTTRARWLAQQRADEARGRFNERVLQFNFGAVGPASSAELVQTVTSQGGRYVRCVAMRGTLVSSAPSGLDLAQTRMRVLLNGGNDLIGGNGTNFVSMGLLFDDITSPWLWWLSPIVLRAGDRLAITVVNTTAGELAPTFFPEIGLRLMDDQLWQELYSRDWRKERA